MRVRDAVAIAVLGGPLLLLAGDFWRDKEPSQWTSEEVSQMLTKSPWAKEVKPSVNPEGGGMRRRGGGMGGPGMGGPGGGGWGGMGGPGMGGPGMGGGGWGGQGGGMGRRGGEGRGPMEGRPSEVTVRWDSATPVHEALVKSEVADASKFAEWSKDFYVVTVSGLPQMRRSPHQNEDAESDPDPDRDQQRREHMQERLKQNTSLKVKGKSALSPSRVEMLENPGAGRTVAFLFSRNVSITPNDKEVTFETSMGPVQVSSKFALKDMLYRGKLEL